MAIGTPPKKMFELENHRTTWGLIQLAMFDSWRAFRWMFNPCLCSNSTDHLHHTGRCLATGDSNSLQKYKWQPVFPLKMILVNGGFHIFYHLAILFNHFTRGCKVFRREYYTNKAQTNSTKIPDRFPKWWMSQVFQEYLAWAARCSFAIRSLRGTCCGRRLAVEKVLQMGIRRVGHKVLPFDCFI